MAYSTTTEHAREVGPARLDLAPARPSARVLAAYLALAIILVLALGLRIRNLDRDRGTLGVDEARLVLAAQGILEHGRPVFPTGKVYTRGLVQSTLTAASLAVVRPFDLAARLPSVLAGTLLVAVVFVYGRQLGGALAGLAAASLAATSLPLVVWSREAWLYSEFVLLWVLALYLYDRALSQASARALVLGGLTVGIGLLAHELTVFLLPAVALSLLLWLRGAPRSAPRWPTVLLSLAPIAAGVALQLVFSLRLRSDTVGGTLSEVAKYLRPADDLSGLQFYVYEPLLAGWRWPLAAAALAGLLLAERRVRGRLALPLGSGLTLLVAICWAAERTERYGLVLLPIAFILAGVGLASVAYRLNRTGGRVVGPLVAAGLLVAVLVTQVDPAALARETSVEHEGETWVEALYQQGYRPDDLLLTDVPIVVSVYHSPPDGWLRSGNYDKYAGTGSDGLLRDIHSGAIVIRSVQEFERLVREPNRGRRAWVLRSNLGTQWSGWIDEELRDYIQSRTSLRIEARDRKRIYLIRL